MDLSKLSAELNRRIWEPDPATLPAGRALLLRSLRVAEVMLRDILEGQLNLRAMSLVYTTLLSIVPLLAVSFSVLKAFGVHNQVEPLLLGLLAPLGPQGEEITTRILGFVDNLRVGVLGAVGLGLLIYTVVALMQKIERAFNYAWYVKRNRSFAQRFSDYLSVLIIGPVLVFSALGLTASLMSHQWVQYLASIEPFGTLIGLATRLTPYALIIAAFTFLYVFVPNTRVRLGPALVGALVAGVLWQTTGWAFASLIVSSAKYTAIYSAFATLILFMLWLYLTWLILLVGASIAFYVQNPNYVTPERKEVVLSARMQEKLALLVMYWIGRHLYRGGPAWTLEGLAGRLGVPSDLLGGVVDALCAQGLLRPSGDDPPVLLAARPLDATGVGEVLRAVRAAGEGKVLTPERLPPQPEVDRLGQALEAAREQALEGMTLKDLALAGEERPAQTPGRQVAGL